jgi:antitoxin HigA-1
MKPKQHHLVEFAARNSRLYLPTHNAASAIWRLEELLNDVLSLQDLRKQTERMESDSETDYRRMKSSTPGELLRDEILPALDRPKTEIAKLLGVSRQTLYDILEERQPVTPAMALRLGKLCGNGPELWLNLQKRYDLHRAQQKLGE